MKNPKSPEPEFSEKNPEFSEPELNEKNAQHLCACKIVVGGDPGTVVVREAHNPVTWTEIAVLQLLHGDDAIYDIKPIGLMARSSNLNEKQRLASIYGFEAVDAVYAGRSFNMEFFAPGWPVDPTGTGTKKRPPDRPSPPRVKMFKPEDIEEAV